MIDSFNMIRNGIRHKISTKFKGGIERNGAFVELCSAKHIKVGYYVDIPRVIRDMEIEIVRHYFMENEANRRVLSIDVYQWDKGVDNCIRHLAYFPEIEILKLLSDSIIDNDLRVLTYLQSLTILVLRSSFITDKSLTIIDKLGKLESLDCAGCNGLSVGRFMQCAANLPCLKHAWPPGSNSWGDIIDRG
jgi:hypothetical protein